MRAIRRCNQRPCTLSQLTEFGYSLASRLESFVWQVALSGCLGGHEPGLGDMTCSSSRRAGLLQTVLRLTAPGGGAAALLTHDPQYKGRDCYVPSLIPPEVHIGSAWPAVKPFSFRRSQLSTDDPVESGLLWCLSLFDGCRGGGLDGRRGGSVRPKGISP